MSDNISRKIARDILHEIVDQVGSPKKKTPQLQAPDNLAKGLRKMTLCEGDGASNKPMEHTPLPQGEQARATGAIKKTLQLPEYKILAREDPSYEDLLVLYPNQSLKYRSVMDREQTPSSESIPGCSFPKMLYAPIGYTPHDQGLDTSDMTDVTDTEDGAWGPAPEKPEKPMPPLPADRGIKHPTEAAWTLWLFEKRHKNYVNNHLEIATFDTFEDFWLLYSHTKLPGDLEPGMDYAVFREGTRPVWEDVNNASGGRWIVPFSTKIRYDTLNVAWIHGVLALLGEAFPQAHDICGITVMIREKRDKIALWTRSARRDRNNKAIGVYLKEVLDVSPGHSVKYFAHCDAATPQKFLYYL